MAVCYFTWIIIDFVPTWNKNSKNFEEFIEKSLKSLREEGVKFEQQKQADSNA